MSLAGADYFAAFVSESPLKHTWSLAIEEQFYVAVPAAAGRAGARRGEAGSSRSRVVLLGLVAGAGALASAGLDGRGCMPTAPRSRGLYYGTDTRAQSLLVGVALAAWRQRPRRAPIRRATSSSPRNGRQRMHRVVGSGYRLRARRLRRSSWCTRTAPYPLLRWLPRAAMAQALVLQRRCSSPDCFRRALAWQPLVWVGGMAYGLYLFHFPLFLWLSPERVGIDGIGLFVLRFAATFALTFPVFNSHRATDPSPSGPRRYRARAGWRGRCSWRSSRGALLVHPPAQPTKHDLLGLVPRRRAPWRRP